MFCILHSRVFYCFSTLSEGQISCLLNELKDCAEEFQVRGTVLLATEGVNGTICGSTKGIASLLQILQESLLDKTLQVKVSWTPQQAFRRFKARRKYEIVTMGITGIDPLQLVGEYVEPFNWNKYIECL